MNNPFRYFNSSPEVIRLAVMMYIRYPLSLRQLEDILFERGIDICHETVRFWWNRFGPMFAGEIRRRRVHGRNWSNWRWNLDEVCSATSRVRRRVASFKNVPEFSNRCLMRIPLKVTSRSRSKLPVNPVQKYHPIHGKVTAWAVADERSLGATRRGGGRYG